MKRLLCAALLHAACIPALRACDVCGCSASNQYLGILPDLKYHFVGIQYQYSSFRSSHPALFDPGTSEQGRDAYHTAQVWGRLALGHRWQLFGFLPYRASQSWQDGEHTAQNGVGDASVLANLVLIRERDTARLKHQLLAGGGLKLPTGRYTGITAADRQGLPNLQPGTGSWDFLINANYTVRKGRWGVNADASYTLTLPNAAAYKYGNRLSSGLTVFRAMGLGAVTVLPQAGLRFEYSLHDYDNYTRKWLNEQSGGSLCFAAAGLQASYRQVGARCTYQLPVAQDYGAGYVQAVQKLDVGVFLLF